MTTISPTASQPASPAVAGGFVRLLGGWANNLATYWVRREAIKTLRQLDDHALGDIGLSRCLIEAAVSGEISGEQQ